MPGAGKPTLAIDHGDGRAHGAGLLPFNDNFPVPAVEQCTSESDTEKTQSRKEYAPSSAKGAISTGEPRLARLDT